MASCGEVAEYPSLYKCVRVPTLVKCQNNAKSPQPSVLVCPLWATAETWCCNMADSLEEVLLYRYKGLILS